MEVFLLILKILGFALLGILALLVLVIALLLFVPFRYKAIVRKRENEELFVRGQVSWLLQALLAFAELSDGKPDLHLRIFWLFKKKIVIPEKKTKEEEAPEEEETETEEKKPFKERLEEWKKKIRIFFRFVEDERNQNAVSLVMQKLIAILRAVMPKSADGFVEFGASDPASTAQALSVVSALLPLHKNRIDVIPDFENEKFLCDANVKGRVFGCRLAFLALSVVLNKDVRYFIRTFKKYYANNGGKENG